MLLSTLVWPTARELCWYTDEGTTRATRDVGGMSVEIVMAPVGLGTVWIFTLSVATLVLRMLVSAKTSRPMMEVEIVWTLTSSGEMLGTVCEGTEPTEVVGRVTAFTSGAEVGTAGTVTLVSVDCPGSLATSDVEVTVGRVVFRGAAAAVKDGATLTESLPAHRAVGTYHRRRREQRGRS